MRLGAWILAMAGGCSLLTGCVERRFVITTDPPGAIVYDEKGMPIGAAPADRPFTYYGKYSFTLVKDGYQTQKVEESIQPPWYQWFLIDFFTENLVPYPYRDIRRIHVPLQPAQMVPPEQVLQQAQEMRQRGQGIGTQGPAPTPTPFPTQPQVAGP